VTTPKAREWAAEYRRTRQLSLDLSAPSETLIRAFKGTYIPDMPTDFSGMRALDVGCGTGNNAFFLASLKLDVYCTEIHQDICDLVMAEAKSMGHRLTVKVATNRSLPFTENFFDFLVSWNVLHYENTEENIRAGIAEYARVLKPGGRLVLSTTGPEHKILTGSKTLGPHLYEIGREDDFRKGERFFYFDAPNYIHYYFDPAFSDVLIGRTHDTLFTSTLDWWIVTGRKKG
jgi:SAM-dependent methyltransferase